MSKTLYAELVSNTARDFAYRTDALNANVPIINRFGEMCTKFKLVPHVNHIAGDGISMVARSERGDDHIALLDGLKKDGYKIDEPIKTLTQFKNDGWAIWTAQIHGHTLSFSLLFYIPLDVA